MNTEDKNTIIAAAFDKLIPSVANELVHALGVRNVHAPGQTIAITKYVVDFYLSGRHIGTTEEEYPATLVALFGEQRATHVAALIAEAAHVINAIPGNDDAGNAAPIN